MFHKRLLEELKEHRILLVGMVLVQWIALLLQVVMVYAIAVYISQVATKEVTVRSSVQLLIVMLIVVIGKSGMNSLHQRLSFKASSVVKTKLREKIFQKLMKIGVGYTEVIPTAETVQISTEGVEQLEIYFAKYVPQFFYSLLAPVTLFVITCQMNMKVAVILLVCVPLIPVSIMAVQKFAKRLLQKYWGSYTELGDSFLENIKGLTTMKIFGADERYEKKMNEEAETFRKITMRVLIMQLNSISMMDLVAFGGAALGIFFSIFALQKQEISFVQCFFMIMISAEFFLPLRLLGSYFHIAMNGNAAANKIFKLLDEEPTDNCITLQKQNTEASAQKIQNERSAYIEKETSDKQNERIAHIEKDTTNKQNEKIAYVEKNTSNKQMEIVCQHVSFAYDKTMILKDISFQIPKHSFTAIVGFSGCGKSTLASLLMGWQQGYQGVISYDGMDARTISKQERLQRVTYVGHNSYILKGTVRETLQMGNPHATESEMCNVLEQVDMLSIIMDKGGLDLELQEGASNLSGGQKQRLAIARAILHDSDCYIFDEATSNVDVESEDCILQVIQNLSKEKTIIMISHRLANVICADQIIFLQDGKILEQGNHASLLQLESGAYRTLFLQQLALEEVRKESAKYEE